MPLQLSSFSEPVRALLADLDGRPFPLIRSKSGRGAGVINEAAAGDLFPDARYPNEALSGLFLRLDNWEKSHQLSQELDTAEGTYWHGIAHRLEPDYGNAGYWFRRVGQHAIFPQLHAAASSILTGQRIKWQLSERWDPFLFLRWCEEANEGGKQEELAAASAIQNVEWELLFEWCGGRI
jgi:hypothetical protein